MLNDGVEWSSTTNTRMPLPSSKFWIGRSKPRSVFLPFFTALAAGPAVVDVDVAPAFAGAAGLAAGSAAAGAAAAEWASVGTRPDTASRLRVTAAARTRLRI